MSGDDIRSPSGGSVQRKASYLKSILVLFVIPVSLMLAFLKKRISPKPFWLSVGTVSIIGWIWSWVVSSNQWWTFGWEHMTGIYLVPHLPIEEVLFYPLGGAFCLLVYVWILTNSRLSRLVSPGFYWGYIFLGSAVFGTLAYLNRAEGPFYLYSQFVVYNFLCTFLLAPFVARRMNLAGMLAPVFLLGTIGYLWDVAAFSKGWWAYHAITQIKVGIVPIDDFNFFLFAPPSAISIYICFCRILKTPVVVTPS